MVKFQLQLHQVTPAWTWQSNSTEFEDVVSEHNVSSKMCSGSAPVNLEERAVRSQHMNSFVFDKIGQELFQLSYFYPFQALQRMKKML